jgi:hypothetical protein
MAHMAVQANDIVVFKRILQSGFNKPECKSSVFNISAKIDVFLGVTGQHIEQAP